MALGDINPIQKKKGGIGGLLGSIFGGLAAAVGAAFTGGATLKALPAIISAGGAGAGVGGAVGTAADPVKFTQSGGPSLLDSATKKNQDVQLATLNETANDIMAAPSMAQPQKDELLNSFINPARDALKRYV